MACHVTPTIFGSTVGYPSDSLASCLKLSEPCAGSLSPSFNEFHTVVPATERRVDGEVLDVVGLRNADEAEGSDVRGCGEMLGKVMRCRTMQAVVHRDGHGMVNDSPNSAVHE